MRYFKFIALAELAISGIALLIGAMQLATVTALLGTAFAVLSFSESVDRLDR